MGLAFPTGLLLGALALPLVLLYVLKLRRRPVSVSSTLLWKRVIEDRRANAPWERLRRHLLLLLQLLFLALLVLAFAGPYRHGSVTLAQDTVVVLDGSASMLALGADGRERFERALEEATRLAAAAEPGRRVGLVLAGPEPRVLAPLTGDVARLRRALAAARPLEAPGDLGAAVELARHLVRDRTAGEVVVLSDGALAADAALLERLAEASWVRVGEGGPNAGIVSVALRRRPGGAGTQEVFAGVASRGGPAQSAELVLESLSPDGAWTERARTSLVLEPDRRHGRLFEVEALADTELRLRLETDGPDALAVDDEARLVVPPPPDVRVLLVSESPWLLSRALGAVAGVRLYTAAGLPEDADGFDLIVLDGLVPDVPPRTPLLVFGAGPEGSEGPFAARGRREHPRVLRWDRRHPALRHVDLDSVLVEEAWTVSPPPGASVLVETDAGPLASSWQGAGGPVLHFAFDLLRSDLALRVAFPVLVHDAVDWLTARHGAAAVLPAGRSTELRVGETKGPARWTQPDGVERLLTVTGGTVRVPSPEQTGRYQLRWTPAEPPGAVAMERIVPVALLSADESDLRPRLDEAALAARAEAGAATPERVAGRRFLWPWLVALALALALVEWTVHHRRPA